MNGDTLHHIFGINAHGSRASNNNMHERKEKSHNLSQMRWLIIDEISQVNAELLKQCEDAARCMIQGRDTYLIIVIIGTKPALLVDVCTSSALLVE